MAKLNIDQGAVESAVKSTLDSYKRGDPETLKEVGRLDRELLRSRPVILGEVDTVQFAPTPDGKSTRIDARLLVEPDAVTAEDTAAIAIVTEMSLNNVRVSEATVRVGPLFRIPNTETIRRVLSLSGTIENTEPLYDLVVRTANVNVQCKLQDGRTLQAFGSVSPSSTGSAAS